MNYVSMDGKRAVVTLHPLSLSDSIPYRSLTFTADSDHVEIGRASKREAKNLAPTDKNGLFDSRVMSRNHATIRACLDKKVISISDGGSMHGTRINGKKLSVYEEVPIKTGDLVVFGTEVTRGRDTYPPLSVRCECQWFGFEENKPASTSNVDRPKIATNTFCVPDDDDDDDNVEIIGQPAPVISTVESSSDSEEDSEDGSVVEVLSSITIPPKDIDGEIRGGSQQTPIDVDNEQNGQPLATPRMTPSSNEDALAEAEGEAQEQSDDSRDSQFDSMLDYSEGDLASQSDDDDSGSDEESMSDSSFESDIELSDADGYSVTVHIPSYPESRKPSQADTSSGKKENATSHLNSQGEHDPRNRADGTSDLLPNQPPVNSNMELPGIRADVMNPNPQNTLEPDVVCKPIPKAWSSSQQLYANTHHPLQPYGKIFDHSLTGFHSNSFGRELEEWSSRGNAPYQYPQPRNGLRINDLPLNEACPRYYDGPFVHQPTISGVTTDVGGPKHGVDLYTAPGTMRTEGIPNDTGSEGQNAHSRPDTRLRISNIVSSLPQPQMAPRKRKAADMDDSSLAFSHSVLHHNTAAFDYNGSNESSHVGVELDQVCLPDAQPQLDPSGIEESYTQITTMSGANEANSIDDLTHSESQVERPSKRQKTSDMSKIGSHAATAVVSAMIGAVGTVALLASLPSDYFI